MTRRVRRVPFRPFTRRSPRAAAGGPSGGRAGARPDFLLPLPSGLSGAPASPVGRYLNALGFTLVVVLGAWLGLVAVGSTPVQVGPVDTRMALRPSLNGGTAVNVSPLGALTLDSHRAPLRLDVDVDQLDPERAQALVRHPERLSGLQDEVARDVGHGTGKVAARTAAAAVCGACALGLVVYRRPRRALAAGGLACALLAASGVCAYATWNPKSVLEPRFSGLLTSAPQVVGSARSIVSDFDVYQKELARLVTNVTKLYDATSTLPVYQPDPTTLRVLHVSDIHLNPAAWHIVGSLIKEYDIDAVIDSGDTMDHGTEAENTFLDPIADLGVPYVWVRGNHDSALTQRYLSRMKNVRVLDDGRAVTVAGVRIAGIGDPQFTPDRSQQPGGDEAEHAAGLRLAAALAYQERAGTPVDIAVAHEPLAAEQTDGLVPLALAGHIHHRETKVLPKGTRLKVEGSTGGGGLRAVQNDSPEKVRASVLYVDSVTKRLQAWDEITLGGLGLTTAEVSRHLPEDSASPAASTPPVPLGPAAHDPRLVPPPPSTASPSVPSPSAPSPSAPSPSAPSPR